MAPKRRRSERGPISLAVRALLELPDTIVAEILRLVDTGRYLEDGYGLANYRGVYRQWAGTQRMVNRRRLISKYMSDDERVGWLKEVTDLGFITYDGPAGFRVQGQGTINVLPRYRSPF